MMLEADMTKKMIELTGGAGAVVDSIWEHVTPYAVRLAIVVITVTPIIMVYPFLQKYIVKGVLIGSIKG